MKDLNKKHPSIKFDYKASKDRIVLLVSIEIYLHNGKFHTNIYRKETDQYHYLHIKSEHPKSLKDPNYWTELNLIELNWIEFELTWNTLFIVDSNWKYKISHIAHITMNMSN